MHFRNRTEAGQQLADLLGEYRYENTVVVALNKGGVVVGEPIATQLHTPLYLMLSEPIELPGLHHELVGTLNQRGDFIYSNSLQAADVQGLESEFRGSIEEQKIRKNHDMNQLLGEPGIVSETVLREHVVILVSDGLADQVPVQAALEYMKPLTIKKLVVTAPMAAIDAIDYLHVNCDQMHILQPMGHIEDLDRFYDEPDIPEDPEILATLKQIVLRWA